MTDYEGNIPSEWDRSGPASQFRDITTGALIGDIDYSGGWTRLGDGLAVRADDPGFNPEMRPLAQGGPPHEQPGAPRSDSPALILLL